MPQPTVAGVQFLILAIIRRTHEPLYQLHGVCDLETGRDLEGRSTDIDIRQGGIHQSCARLTEAIRCGI